MVGFFIELISEIPTYGCKENKNDIEIYKNGTKNEARKSDDVLRLQT